VLKPEPPESPELVDGLHTSNQSHMSTSNDKKMQDNAQTQFAAAVKKQLSPGAKGWSGDNTEAVIKEYLIDEHGNSNALSSEDELLLRLAVNPTVELQVEALKLVFERAGKPLDEYQWAFIRKVLNPQMFRKALGDQDVIKLEKRLKLKPLGEMLG
jgi:hypothetical protein